MLMAYVRAIVRDPELTEDTFNDVCVEIVRCWDRFDKSKPFGPWARGVARRVALANLRKRRNPSVLVDSDVLEAVATELDAYAEQAEAQSRKQALAHCLEKLTDVNRQLVRMRYWKDLPMREIASDLNRSVDGLYVAFSRIHKALRECVRKRLEKP